MINFITSEDVSCFFLKKKNVNRRRSGLLINKAILGNTFYLLYRKCAIVNVQVQNAARSLTTNSRRNIDAYKVCSVGNILI